MQGGNYSCVCPAGSGDVQGGRSHAGVEAGDLADGCHAARVGSWAPATLMTDSTLRAATIGDNRRWRSCREATVLVGGIWCGGDSRQTNVEVKGEGADLIEFP